MDLWQELKVLSFARTLSATWLVALLDLLLRVQLNILGRHLFLQTHILDAATCAPPALLTNLQSRQTSTEA